MKILTITLLSVLAAFGVWMARRRIIFALKTGGIVYIALIFGRLFVSLVTGGAKSDIGEFVWPVAFLVGGVGGTLVGEHQLRTAPRPREAAQACIWSRPRRPLTSSPSPAVAPDHRTRLLPCGHGSRWQAADRPAPTLAVHSRQPDGCPPGTAVDTDVPAIRPYASAPSGLPQPRWPARRCPIRPRAN